MQPSDAVSRRLRAALWPLAAGILLVGYVALWRGVTGPAAAVLIAAYCAVVPGAIMLGRRR